MNDAQALFVGKADFRFAIANRPLLPAISCDFWDGHVSRVIQSLVGLGFLPG